jgi:small GTP-binding protein
MQSPTGLEYLFKFVVTGDSGVGKTNLISRFRRDEFSMDTRATIGIEFASWTMHIDGDKVKTNIWDTAGQERYGSILTPAFYRGAAGAMIVYDIADRQTYEDVSKWLKILREGNTSADLVIMMVGNKSDLEASRVVSTEEAETLAKENGFFFTETSAKDSVNVVAAFEGTIREIHRIHSRFQRPPLKTADAVAVTESTIEAPKGRCC